jgi:serine/arginine repetitive matrix protein 2
MRAASPTPQYHLPRPASLIGLESQPSSPTSPAFDKSFFQNPLRRPSATKAQVPEDGGGIPSLQEQQDRTNTSLAELDNHFAIWWECADLLVELGSAAPPAVAATPVKSPTMASLQRAAMTNDQSTPKPKERHATLPRHEPPPRHDQDVPSSFGMSHGLSSSDSGASLNHRRGSTGQQDLNPRQIQLLKGMLATPNPNDLSSSVDFGSFYAGPTSTLSPVISHPSSSVRSGVNFETPRVLPLRPDLTDDEDAMNDKEEKRSRRISLAGRLGVREILASLKRTKAKVMKQRTRPQSVAPDEPARTSADYAAGSRSSIDQSRSVSQAPPSPRAGYLRENLNVGTPAQTGAPPSPYKRNRRRSLASIFKLGNLSTSQNEDKILSYSRSRIDLASPTPGEEPGFRHAGVRMDDGVNTDADSDWDYMNSPSDIPGRYKTLQRNLSSSQDLSNSATQNRGRSAPVGVPIGSSRGGSTVSRNTSTSRNVYTSASASAASLTSNSFYGSAASHQSLHEAFGGRGISDKSEDERRRLKKPVKSARRPPSAGRRKSIRTSSHTSLPSQTIGITPPGITSPIMEQAYSTALPGSYQSQTNTLSHHSTFAHSVSECRRTPSMTDISSPRLAFTPENIVPLLVYAREVKLKLQECITEVKLIETDLLLARAAIEDNEDTDGNGSVEMHGGRMAQ